MSNDPMQPNTRSTHVFIYHPTGILRHVAYRTPGITIALTVEGKLPRVVTRWHSRMFRSCVSDPLEGEGQALFQIVGPWSDPRLTLECGVFAAITYSP